jgi:iron(III) transport system substrate-binding protein
MISKSQITFTACALALVLAAAAGCWSRSTEEVVVYAALDREFSEPLLEEFHAQTGVRVLPKYDVESTKTVGLVNAIIQEQARPRCDLFWNNEILHTLRLEKMGLLAPCPTDLAAKFPTEYRSPQGTWYGFAARVRVLIVNTQVVPEPDRPRGIGDLVDPKWKGRVGIAKPLFGTTATHAAVLFAHWGEARAKRFFQDLKGNAQVFSGNKQVAVSVARGELAFGLTDTDDAIVERDGGMPVEIIYPDQEEGGLGALFIPNTLALIQGASNPLAAQRLIDFLLSPEVEAKLAAGPSAQFPLNPAVTAPSRAAPPQPLRRMRVDFTAAATAWDSAAIFLRDTFSSP